MSTLLGFDFGTHKIGIAVGQTITKTASPLITLGRVKHKPDWESINKLIQEWTPDELIVGMPYEMSGNEAEIADKAKRFARQLHGRYQIPVHMIDEKLTSREAWTILGNEAAKDVTRVDSMAAALILETWFSVID